MAEHIDESEVLQRALDTYGSLPQIVMIFEEMSELQKELCKYLRGKYSPENIAEEIADVEIMLEQMMMLFCCADDVRDWRRRKVARLKKRLDGDSDAWRHVQAARLSFRRPPPARGRSAALGAVSALAADARVAADPRRATVCRPR